MMLVTQVAVGISVKKITVIYSVCVRVCEIICRRLILQQYLKAQPSLFNTVGHHWLTSTVHLTKVWKSPHVAQSDSIWYTGQHKLPGVVPARSRIFFHDSVLRRSPGFSQQLKSLQAGVCVAPRLSSVYKVAVFTAWSVSGGGSSDRRVIRLVKYLRLPFSKERSLNVLVYIVLM